MSNNIRPLSVLIESNLFFDIFQNFEKIFSLTQFINRSIIESFHLTNNQYLSTVNVIHEHISILSRTYDVYFKGYSKASSSLNDKQFTSIAEWFKKNKNLDEINFIQLISLPITNITKMYAAFVSLLEMTHFSEFDEYNRLSSVCNILHQVIHQEQEIVSYKCSQSTNRRICKISHDDLIYDESKFRNNKHQTTNFKKMPFDYTDNDGNKVYFL